MVPQLWAALERLAGTAERRAAYTAEAGQFGIADVRPQVVEERARARLRLIASADQRDTVLHAIAAVLSRPAVPAWCRAVGIGAQWCAVGGNVSGLCSVVQLVDRPAPSPHSGPRYGSANEAAVVLLDARHLVTPELFAKIVAHELGHAVLGVEDAVSERIQDLRAEAAACLWGFELATPERYLESTPDADGGPSPRLSCCQMHLRSQRSATLFSIRMGLAALAPSARSHLCAGQYGEDAGHDAGAAS
jgi:hypothetical protein